METQKILQRLEPLMPREVERWKRTLLIAQPEVKSLLERQILSTALNVLGDFRNKPLLSLPPQKSTSGQLHLGKVIYEKEKWNFGLQPSELMQNLAIFGRSGAGKTNISFHTYRRITIPDSGV